MDAELLCRIEIIEEALRTAGLLERPTPPPPPVGSAVSAMKILVQPYRGLPRYFVPSSVTCHLQYDLV